MIAVISAYFLTFFVMRVLIKHKKTAYKPFPKLEIDKDGISFFSNQTHRIMVENCKLLQLEDTAYLKYGNSMVTLKRVSNIKAENNFIYFKAEGDVKIVFNVKEVYRYLNIIIKSNKFNIYYLKQQVLLEMLNSMFSLSKCKLLNKYLNFVKNVLKINIDNQKIKIGKNQFNLNYFLIYKVNNIVKRIKVEQNN